MTALHVAVRQKLLSVVSLLLSHSASVNMVSRYDHRTPLHVAAMTGHAGIVRLLVENRANVDHADVYGSTALHLAVVCCQLDTAQVNSEVNVDLYGQALCYYYPRCSMLSASGSWYRPVT